VLSLAPPRVAVVDTVGAGDTPAAGLRTGLLAEGVSTRPALEALTDERLLEILDDALLIAALNCTRVGVDPPTRAEVAEHRRAAG
jgi:fructokinase